MENKFNLDLYDDYCLFIRQSFLEGEDKSNIENVSIEDLQTIYSDGCKGKIPTGDVKVLINYNNGSSWETHLIKTIGYLKWLKSIERDRKLSELLND